jgi:hypothetical protein
MLFALSNGISIEREVDIIGGNGDCGKEAKCILAIDILGITLIDRVECHGDLFRCGCVKVQATRRAKDDVVAEPG